MTRATAILPRDRPRRSRRAPTPADEGRRAPPGRRLTEAEFVDWMDSKTRAEWVDGEVVLMSPASFDHAKFVTWLLQVVGVFVDENDLGEVLGPEFFVRLPRQRRRRLPDLLFVATPRLSQVRQNHFEGAPDAIFEVVSPDSVSRDWREKFLEFEKAGVREYWIIDRDARRVEAYKLTRSGKFEQIQPVQGRLRSAAIAGLQLKLDWLLAWPLPKASACLRELGVRI